MICAIYFLHQLFLQLGVKDNMCGKCYKLCPKCTGSFARDIRRLTFLTDRMLTFLLHSPGKEGFILENNHGLRWGPNELGFDDNRLSAGEYNGQNYCMLAKYGNKGQFTSKDFPSSRRYVFLPDPSPSALCFRHGDSFSIVGHNPSLQKLSGGLIRCRGVVSIVQSFRHC